jgi:hypothetical protein
MSTSTLPLACGGIVHGSSGTFGVVQWQERSMAVIVTGAEDVFV